MATLTTANSCFSLIISAYECNKLTKYLFLTIILTFNKYVAVALTKIKDTTNYCSTLNTVKFLQFVRKMSKSASVEQLSALRMKYNERKDAFLEQNIKIKDPFCVFRDWLTDALNTKEIIEPNAAALATVSAEGKPSNRFVLVKEATAEGFTFFTNYGSRKADDIANNANVAIAIYWMPLRRSVRIEGVAEKISQEASLKYFHERPRASQIGAAASPQSQPIPSRSYLDEVEASIKAKLGADGEVPLPNWGGYLVRPSQIEFWQGQTDRLHDRIRFRRGSGAESEIDGKLLHAGENGWVYERLAP